MSDPTTALFVMPRRPAQWGGAAALWVTAAGWAEAARDRFGDAWVVSPDGVDTPARALEHTRAQGGARSAPRGSWVPDDVRTLLKDLRQYSRARAFRPSDSPEWEGQTLAFVWQHHDVFHRAGESIARRHGCPLVSYVHAPQVWEARKWGVRRPGYGGLIEQFGERGQLRKSDVVCCVSEEVARSLERLGVTPERVLVSPMAVDPVRFDPTVDGTAIRRQLGLADAFVVGWTGSFRGFHGLESVVEAFGKLEAHDPTARLLLVGDGPERSALQEQLERRGLTDAVVFAGSVANPEIPQYIAAMDVAVVSARSGDEFHYSPLKLREYLACGRAVVAPRLGEIPLAVQEGEEAVLYTAGDVEDLSRQLIRLGRDPALRDRLGARGRARVVETGTWSQRLRELLEFPAYRAAVERHA